MPKNKMFFCLFLSFFVLCFVFLTSDSFCLIASHILVKFDQLELAFLDSLSTLQSSKEQGLGTSVVK